MTHVFYPFTPHDCHLWWRSGFPCIKNRDFNLFRLIFSYTQIPNVPQGFWKILNTQTTLFLPVMMFLLNPIQSSPLFLLSSYSICWILVNIKISRNSLFLHRFKNISTLHFHTQRFHYFKYTYQNTSVFFALFKPLSLKNIYLAKYSIDIYHLFFWIPDITVSSNFQKAGSFEKLWKVNFNINWCI